MYFILNISNKVKIYWKSITITLLLIISIMSLIPRLELQIGLSFHDKIFHFLAYFVLSLPVIMANPKFVKFFLIFFILYGGFIEIVQPFVNRSCDVYDFLANFIGVTFAYFIIIKLRRLISAS